MTQSRKAHLHLDNLHEVMSASPDGARMGQMQFETPAEIARLLSLPLPRRRWVVADLQCGHGALLKAAKNDTTEACLGVDIDPTAPDRGRIVAVANICEFFPLLRAVDAKFPLLVLNPPFGLRWPATNIPAPTHKGKRFGYSGRRLAEPHLDSTYATWLMAHQLLAPYGEGYIITNAETAERLIAPCGLAERAWLWVKMPNFFYDAPGLATVAIIYFAADHRGGPHKKELKTNSTLELENLMREAASRRHNWIRGQTADKIGTLDADDKAAELRHAFDAAKGEWERRQAESRGEHGDWNIYLRNARIAIYLTPFQNLSGVIPKATAEALFRLNHRTPLELMVMRDTRVALEDAIHSKIWRVHPDLIKAVAKARLEYEDVRTPFTRPALAQRIGWLDEQEQIACTRDWRRFEAGKMNRLRTITFTGQKIVLQEGPQGIEEVLVSGQELAILISDGEEWHAFTYHPIKPESIPEEIKDAKHFHGLRDLLDHFAMPDIQSLAERQPQRYEQNLRALEAMEVN